VISAPGGAPRSRQNSAVQSSHVLGSDPEARLFPTWPRAISGRATGNPPAIVASIDTQHQFGGVWDLYLPVMAVVVVVVFLATLVPLVLFSRRRRGATEPSRKSTATVAEAAYAAVLVVIAIVFVTKTFRTESRIDAVAATGDTVQVVAFQWGWTFQHDGKTVTGDDRHNPTLVVKAGRTIRFRMISRDVIHSFWIPSERYKRDAFPKRWTEFDLTFAKPGRYVGRCAEFCGLQHAGMGFTVEAT
jgi:cytochrome c oxidase subunit 2